MCINCGLCQKRCPQNNIQDKHNPIKVLAVRYKNDTELKDSASGGASSLWHIRYWNKTVSCLVQLTKKIGKSVILQFIKKGICINCKVQNMCNVIR